MEIIEYKGFNIEVDYDYYAENPFISWDFNPPVFLYQDRSFQTWGQSDYDLRYLPDLNRDEIKNNIDTLKSLTGCSSLLSFISDNRYQFDNAVELINDSLQEFYSGSYDSDKLDFYASILQIKNIECQTGSLYGQSQSDYADFLIVVDENFIKTTGIDPDNYSLNGDIELLNTYYSGEVFCYSINDGEVGYCCGFYGHDHEKSGLLEHAENDIDCHIDYERQKKYKRLKQFIINHVPLNKRVF